MPNNPAPQTYHPLEVLKVFLLLGLTAFGGPMAHIGYFRAECVEKRRWLSDQAFADLVALCQFLPGPSSSQLGVLLGLQRGGYLGALLAWLAFTLPSAFLLMGFAYFLIAVPDANNASWVHGLKVVTVAIVAHAVFGMAKNLCPDWPRRALALIAAILCISLPIMWAQPLALVLCALIAWRFLAVKELGAVSMMHFPVSKSGSIILLILFMFLFAAFVLAQSVMPSATTHLLIGFYQSGALVFGGGHVMLPLLQGVAEHSNAITTENFLAGYGAAQAIPGPLFSFAAFLGVVADWPLQGLIGGLLLLVLIFLPGILLLLAVLPFWQALRGVPAVQKALAGINAAVVGMLLAALYHPVISSAIFSWQDAVLAIACFLLLQWGRVSAIWIVLMAALLGGLLL